MDWGIADGTSTNTKTNDETKQDTIWFCADLNDQLGSLISLILDRAFSGWQQLYA